MEAPAPTGNTFFIQLTDVREEWRDGQNRLATYSFPMITLPPGTVLFRGVKIPNSATGDDPRYFYRDYLGTPEGRDSVCLDPTHNTFFYPFPYIPFGTKDVGKTFQCMQAVVLVHPMTVIAAIAPSTTNRSLTATKGVTTFNGESPWQRCSLLTDYMCHPQSEEEVEALSFDACLHPKYQMNTNVRGWMAIADYDSLRSKKEQKEAKNADETYDAGKSAMGSYLKRLDEAQPGLGAELLCWLYMDKTSTGIFDAPTKARRIGFPEIALYPYRVHSGPQPIKRKIRTTEDAVYYMAEEAKKNNLNYLPLAAFTKDGITDMVNGHFSSDCLGVAEDVFSMPIPTQQRVIEKKVHQWLDMIQTIGLDLPHYGRSKLHFDTRTGFFVFPEMVPFVLRVPTTPFPAVEKEGEEAEAEAEAPAAPLEKKADIPYRFLLLPLENDAAKQRARKYMLMFRNFFPEKLMQRYRLGDKFRVHRAMAFERPPAPFMEKIFNELKISMPEYYKEGLREASRLYYVDSGKKSEAQKLKDAQKALQLATVQVPTMLGVEGPKDQNFFLYDAEGERVAAYNAQTLYAIAPQQMKEMLQDGGRAEDVADAEQHPLIHFASLSDDNKSKLLYLYRWALTTRGVTDEVAIETNIAKLLMDDVCLYSVTESEIAVKMANYIKDALIEIVGKQEASKATITDATVCAGGNALAFCEVFNFINAVDKSPNKAMMCYHNLSLFSYTYEEFAVHCADYLTIMDSLKQHVIFFDPPWGGPGYKNQKNVTLQLGDKNLIDVVWEIYTKGLAYLVAIKAPENYDDSVLLAELVSRAADAGMEKTPQMEVYPMRGMKLLILKNITFAGTETATGTPIGDAIPDLNFKTTEANIQRAKEMFGDLVNVNPLAYNAEGQGEVKEEGQESVKVTTGASKGGRRTTRSKKAKKTRRRTTPRADRRSIDDQHAMAKEFPRVWLEYSKNLR